MGLFEVLAGLLCLSIVVLIHEAGHYISACFRGIKVLTFSIGFGPRLFGVTVNDTEFRFSLIPLGGYCRFTGDTEFQNALRENRAPSSSSPDNFYSATPFSKMIVSFWGPLANVVFSLLLFFFIAWTGYEELYSEPRILLASNWNDDDKAWPADDAGLKDGDYILAINGQSIDRFSDLQRHYSHMPGKEIELKIRRDSMDSKLKITPRMDRETAVLGVLNWLDPVIEEVIEGSVSDTAGLKRNDRILRLNGREIEHTVALSRLLKEFAGSLIEIEIERNGSGGVLYFDILASEEIGLIFRYLKGRSEKLNPLQAMRKSLDKTWFTIVSTSNSLKMLFEGANFNNSVLGPIRLISDTGTIVTRGFKRGLGAGFLWASELMALISLSLALINLLPIPVLDGGQILLFIVEALRRKSTRVRTIYRYQAFGTIIVIIIVLIAVIGDLMYISGGG